ncbi:MAG: CDGSH iron-sulfur domain-containing protein [Woeseiaceae bacterium]
MNEKTPKPVFAGNSIMVRANGPLICKSDIDITLVDANNKLLLKEKEFALCRCGLSKTKPFCDGTHKTSNNEMPQNFIDDREETIDSNEPIKIMVKENAMYSISGGFTLFSRDGLSKTTRKKAALCRCGFSGNKPFCDGQHKTCNFSA